MLIYQNNPQTSVIFPIARSIFRWYQPKKTLHHNHCRAMKYLYHIQYIFLHHHYIVIIGKSASLPFPSPWNPGIPGLTPPTGGPSLSSQDMMITFNVATSSKGRHRITEFHKWGDGQMGRRWGEEAPKRKKKFSDFFLGKLRE